MASRHGISKRKTTLCKKCSNIKTLSKDTRDKISNTLRSYYKNPDNIIKHSQLMKGVMSGPKHWNWQGGKSSINQRDRNSPEYKLWRSSVFSRDEWHCRICESPDGAKLVAHHIQGWATNETLRFNVDNGITLCESCHYLVHKYLELEKESKKCLAQV